MKIATVVAPRCSSLRWCSHRFAASASLTRPLDLPPEGPSYSFAGAINGGEEVRAGLVQHHSSRGPKFRADVAGLIDATSHTIGV